MTAEIVEPAPANESTPSAPKTLSTPRKPWKGLCFSLCVVLAGVFLLWRTAGREYAALEQESWKDAFILFKTPEGVSPSETAPVCVRLAQREQSLPSDLPLELMGALVEWDRFNKHIGLSDPEMVIALELPPEKLQPLLASGRLPEPGKPEVLAGDLARSKSFKIDGIEFQVVGTLKRSVSGFLFAYMLPHGADFADLFTQERGAVDGVLVEHGERLRNEGLLPDFLATPEETEEVRTDNEAGEGVPKRLVVPNYLGGLMRSADRTVLLTLFAMALVAWGGALFQYHLFRRLKAGNGVMLRPFVEEALARPKLFWGTHLFFYGAFFLIMWAVMYNPLLAYRTKQYIEAVFEVGGLGHVGFAYDSRRISYAAWMTFYNNYIEQTLLLTFSISLFPIPLGLIKNLLSFLLVGGAMSPLWVGSSDMLVMHSITMATELEAYILACFAITAWPVMLVSGIRNRSFLKALKQGLLMLLSAMVFTGILLAIAAVYEALTLIHLV
ncbi:MAG: hypothetical protein GXY07_21155 [Candidatus Hydrogenedentes bacterium]|nr:hypothetical protein [Candidatus Hydrogenedentota bacterium]